MNNAPFPRIARPPEGSYFLLGPRGTGKSTWLRASHPGAHYIDLLNESLYQSYLTDIGRFADEIRMVESGGRVVIDEVQRLPMLLNEVHRFIEEKNIRFALCGSSARKLRRGGVNLLAGRAVRRFMHPLLPEEMGDVFSLDETLHWGGLPIVWNSQDRKETLTSYVELYLKEEIQSEALVRNLPGFARFLPVAALFHGQVINVSGIARDAGVARKTAESYLEILVDTLIAFQLPAFQGKLRVRERKHPKLFWADPGLPRAAKRQLGPPTPEEKGHLFEGWIAGLLRAYRDYRGIFDEFYYWAPAEATQTEVDFLLRRDTDYLAIEVKSGKHYDSSSLNGLRAMRDLPNLRRRFLVFLGDRRMETEDGIEVLPVDHFLAWLAQGAPFDR
ncbi:MAG: ATP-binding protein [Candidatus Eisenbacteria bacterium]|uniref:ATP-binding protein n=1 Tax=Eiseniibacteriota bacterium TaxID=2212470 RepID=A0A948W8B1_UNCEI|nr:ATP-binding protein [Candidatus Eisenbacteria bacterium]MBU1948945.1 ATP-binding protein [Candidatus Eisenbacteria bacterium]MBU2693130.1 ATP-binding protein [Candidatus Eisenbacteria bacterium]